MKAKWYNVFALLVVAAVLLAACAPATVTVEAPVERTVEVPVEVTVEVPVEVEVEVPVEVTVAPVPPEPLDVLVYWTGADEEAIRAAVDVYKAEYPDITVNFEALAGTEFKPAFGTEIVTEPRDLYSAWNGTFTMEWVGKEALEDLTGFWEDAGFDDIISEGLKGPGYAEYEGKIYWIPHVLQVRTTFYNKAVFDDLGLVPPTTWAEYINIMETLKANGILPLVAGTMGEAYGIQPLIDHLVVAHLGIDDALKLAQGELSYTDPRVVAAFEDFMDFVDKGYVNDDMFATRFDEALRKFGRGEAGMWWRATWGSSCLVGEFDWVDGVDYGTFTPPPKDPAIPVPGLGYADGWVIPKAAADMELAKEFIKVMVSARAQNAHSVVKGHGLTINKLFSPIAYVEAGFPSKAVQLEDYLTYGIYGIPIGYYTPEFLEDYTVIISDLVTGVIDVSTAIDRLEEARAAGY